MISFYEVIDRAMTGEYCTEQDFEMKKLFPKIQELVSKYNIKYDPSNPVSSDDDLADRVFQAGLELYLEVGTYCHDTERIIRFTEEEIRDALHESPSISKFGEGKDERTLVPRKPDDSIRPFCFVGASGAAVSNEELFSSIVETYASFLPLADSITAPSLATINGRTVRSGSPLEVLASIRSVVLTREALRRGGRPGMPVMNCIATAGSDVSKIAGSQFGVRASDAWIIAFSSEHKIGFQRLNEIATAISLGNHIIPCFSPILGGYCGGPEGTAVANVAYLFSSIIIGRGSALLSFPFHFRYGTTSSRDVIWAKSVSVQAMTRNSHFPVFVDHYTAAGPMTEGFFYENAADIASTVSSGGHILSPGVGKATHTDYLTPMEPRFSTEVGHAVTGMTRKTANDLVNKLLEKYETYLGDPPLGTKYQDCWDIERKTPSEEYVELYKKTKKDLSALGIAFGTYRQ